MKKCGLSLSILFWMWLTKEKLQMTELGDGGCHV